MWTNPKKTSHSTAHTALSSITFKFNARYAAIAKTAARHNRQINVENARPHGQTVVIVLAPRWLGKVHNYCEQNTLPEWIVLKCIRVFQRSEIERAREPKRSSYYFVISFSTCARRHPPMHFGRNHFGAKRVEGGSKTLMFSLLLALHGALTRLLCLCCADQLCNKPNTTKIMRPESINITALAWS